MVNLDACMGLAFKDLFNAKTSFPWPQVLLQNTGKSPQNLSCPYIILTIASLPGLPHFLFFGLH